MSSNIPKLRFPEFSEKWNMTNLGKVCEMQAGKFIPASSIFNSQGVNLYPCYGGNGLRGYTESYTHEGNFSLIGRQGALCGNIIYAVGKFHATEHAVVVSSNNHTDSKWIFYLLGKLHLNQYATGQAQPGLSVDVIKKVSLMIPSNNSEQKKIADFLSAADNKIERLEKILELQKEYKRGVMQRMFNQTMRFKDDKGNSYPNWQETKISSIGEVITGSTPSKSNEDYWGGDFVWVTAQDFKQKYIETSALKLTERGKNVSRVIPKNSILITCIASIGLNAINTVECATNQQINALVCNDEYCTEFIYYAIDFNTNRLKRLAGQTAVPIISKSVFESFSINIPKEKDEQKKIADFLSALDAKIEATQKQLDIARNWKKGLLQKMFV